MSEEGWRGLHPATIAVNLVPRAWRVARGSWPLLLALLVGGRTDRMGFFDLGIVLLFFVVTIGSTILHWLTLRYRVSEGRLEIETGLLNRQVRTIDPERIQNVEMVRNVFHRMSGLVEVKIETASGDEVEGMLSALSEEDAKELVDALQQARRAAPATRPDEELPVLVHNSPADLLRYGATATRLGTVLVLLGIGFEAVQAVTRGDITAFADVPMQIVVPALLLGAWVIGVATSVVRFYDFRLLRGERALIAEEGLFTRRRVELRSEKVQVVSVSEPLVRRWAGFGSVTIETAAAGAGQGGTRTAQAMVPVVSRDRLAEVVCGILPVAVDLDAIELRPAHPRALRRALFGAVIRSALFAGLLGWLFYPWGLLGLLLVPISIALAWFDYRHMGWLVTPDAVVVRNGYWQRETQVMSRQKVQSLELLQGPLLRRHGLGLLTLRAAGAGVTLPPIGWDEARELVDDLSVPVPAPAAEVG